MEIHHVQTVIAKHYERISSSARTILLTFEFIRIKLEFDLQESSDSIIGFQVVGAHERHLDSFNLSWQRKNVTNEFGLSLLF
jgi:hypothetical protein